MFGSKGDKSGEGLLESYSSIVMQYCRGIHVGEWWGEYEDGVTPFHLQNRLARINSNESNRAANWIENVAKLYTPQE